MSSEELFHMNSSLSRNNDFLDNDNIITKVAFQRLRRMSELSFLVAIQATMLFSCRADAQQNIKRLKSATLLKSQSVAAQTAKNAIFLVWTDFLPCVG